MSGGKHTLGQWKISLTDSTVVIAVGRNGISCEVAAIEGDYDNPREWPIMEANHHLIAAAPDTAAERDRLKAVNADLLAALRLTAGQALRSEIPEGYGPEFRSKEWEAGYDAAISVARAAIAKAEGGAE